MSKIPARLGVPLAACPLFPLGGVEKSAMSAVCHRAVIFHAGALAADPPKVAPGPALHLSATFGGGLKVYVPSPRGAS